MAGSAVSTAGQGAQGPIELVAGSRLWAVSHGQTDARALTPDVGLRLTFAQQLVSLSPCVGPMQRGLYRQLGANGDRIQVDVDLGSYLFRVKCGASLVVSSGTWNISIWSGSEDPSPYPQRFWRTFVRSAGTWTPPAFYHLIQIVGVAAGGSVANQGIPLVTGSALSLPPGDLTVAAGAIVQLGFDL